MTSQVITTQVVLSYLDCERKAFLLLFGVGEEIKGSPHEYPLIIKRQRSLNCAKQINVLINQGKEVKQYDASDLLGKKGCISVNAIIKVGDYEAYCDIIEMPSKNHPDYHPILVTGTHRVDKEHRLELIYASHVLGILLNSKIQTGSIIDLKGRTHKLKLANGLKTFVPRLNSLDQWMTSPPAEPPPVVLHKACLLCQYYRSCKSLAEKTDDLSLLDRLTPKLIKRYHDKGIYSLKQLSFLFKPRRSRKHKRRAIEIYKPELQALAIRTGKIYLQGVPELTRQKKELFVDIEGLPDQGFQYLIGLLVCDVTDNSFRNYWAATPQDEEFMFRQFMTAIEEYPGLAIYHYGSYEPKALRQLATRYHTNIESVKKRLINLNAHIFGKIYFPVTSNRLKEIGKFIGASWTSKDASGLKSLIWRHLWEETSDQNYKNMLIQYNREDCQALKLLVDEVHKIGETADLQPNIDFVDHPKRQTTAFGEEIHMQFQAILKCAHADYESKKINVMDASSDEKRKRGATKGHQGFYRPIPDAKEYGSFSPARKICPRCKSVLRSSDKVVEKNEINLIFTENGCFKKNIKLKGIQGFCQKCRRHYRPESWHGKNLFGHGFKSWIIYQRLSLRLPYESIIQSMEDLFRERISPGLITFTIRRFAEFYSETDQLSLQRILGSSFVHVDETKINVQGAEYYVWVFTDGRHVVLRMTETRETTLVAELLKGYKGILISDFYGGYDSIKCQQQRCLVHLLRDMNDDLWKSPFDSDYEEFIGDVKALIVPIIEAAHRYGLNKAYLSGFKTHMESFYENSILGKTYNSEVALKYQKRFRRYRKNLFTFLDGDGIPWNNNMAERALRHLVVQENISKTFYRSTFPQHLLLLGIMQTCRFQKKSFLKFLISEEKDIDLFEEIDPNQHIQKVAITGVIK